MMDAVKGALQLMSGVTEVTVSRARDVATALVEQGLAGNTSGVVEEVQELADDLWTTGKDNREMLLQLVRLEVDRTVNRMGFVREDELASVRRHVDRLEAELAAAQEELAQAREDAATSSIVVAAEAMPGDDIAESVVDSARRIAAVTGALGGVPGLAGGPWARVARDLATSAAGIVAAAATAQTGARRPGGSPASTAPAGGSQATDSTPASTAQETTAAKPTAKKVTAKKASSKKAAAKKSTSKKSAAKKATAKKSPSKKSAAKKATATKPAKNASTTSASPDGAGAAPAADTASESKE